jgi:hypothetical protein
MVKLFQNYLMSQSSIKHRIFTSRGCLPDKVELKLAEVNQKMAKKILKVKQNNEENMLSLGGRSGITAMLSRK